MGSEVVGLIVGSNVGSGVWGVHMSPSGKHWAEDPMDDGQGRALGQGIADRLLLHSDTAFSHELFIVVREEVEEVKEVELLCEFCVEVENIFESRTQKSNGRPTVTIYTEYSNIHAIYITHVPQ